MRLAQRTAGIRYTVSLFSQGYTVQPKSGSVSHSVRIAGAALFIALSLLAGCRTRADREIARQPVEGLYKNARKALDSNDYEYATRMYEALTARFPFSQQARQARLDLIFLYYRKGEKESATDAAEQFIRENPTHPRCDYAWYMQGLVDYERVPYRIERWFGVDSARRPPQTALNAVTAFGTVVRSYPKSDYAHDAQRRMIYLRNRLADFELNVARYYLKRGAFLAAAQRAQRMIELYDGAPAVQEALQIMVQAYDRLKLTDLKSNVEKMVAANYPAAEANSASRKSWWRFW
jgi:outer membrane protein assembly factor BamD